MRDTIIKWISDFIDDYCKKNNLERIWEEPIVGFADANSDYIKNLKNVMLSKSATMLLGLINKQPVNAYEIIKILESMNVKWWYNIADSTVYATLRTLDKKGLIVGASEKNGNMPFRTVYSISEKGKEELRDTLTK